MRKTTAEEYRRQTAEKLNPLKDEPWQRHEWTEGGWLVKTVLHSLILIIKALNLTVFFICFSFQEVEELD